MKCETVRSDQAKEIDSDWRSLSDQAAKIVLFCNSQCNFPSQRTSEREGEREGVIGGRRRRGWGDCIKLK